MYYIVSTTLLLLSSCSNDDVTPPEEHTLSIVKSDLLFEPMGRTGTIEVQTNGTLSAQLDADWCTASVNGRVVSVTVSDNQQFEGRTAVLTLRADGASIQVPVQQRGMALGTLAVSTSHIGRKGGRLSYYIRHDLPVNLNTEDEWLHPHMEGDSLIVNVDANDVWYVRRGILEYECAGYKGELTISQYDLNTILGQYYFGGTMSGAQTGFRFNLVKRGDKYYMVFFTVAEWANDLVPVDFDESRCELIFHSATLIHEQSTSNNAFYFYNANGQIAASEKATMRAFIYYNPFALGDSGTHYATLEDTGAWPNGPLTGFVIRVNTAFLSTNIIQLNNPYIIWVGPEGS